MRVIDIITSEVTDYLGNTVQVSEGVEHSQYKLVRRINIFKNRQYPEGKINKKTAEYKYWFDIIDPRVNNEKKNLRFGSKNILPFSTNPIGDFAAVFTLNAGLDEWMWQTGREDEFTDSIECFSADGNLLFKRVKAAYESCYFDNTFIINQTAKTVDETPIVQRAQLTQSQLRARANVYQNVDSVIKNCGNKLFKKSPRTGATATTNPLYEIFERNGEISERDLFEAQGKEGGETDKYLLARVVVAGLANDKDTEKYVLFAEPLTGKMSDHFIEAHRGPYKGKWWREGLYELLFDHQVRANEIGNQLARGLDWASKVIFKDDNPQIMQNIRTDVQNGDIVRSANLAQVDVRMRGLDQLIADWNRLMADADKVANSYEVLQGGDMPANMPFQLGRLLDTNASKLFVLLRGKLGHAYARVYKEWVLPDYVKSMKAKDIIRITGNADFVERFRTLAVEGWYVKNLAKIGPHTKQMAEQLKQAKLEELSQTEPLLQNMKELWDNILPRIHITITGENYDTSENLQTIAATIQFETDPVRRSFLLDTIYSAKGIPVPPAVQQGMAPSSGSPTNKQIDAIAAGIPAEQAPAL